MVKFRILFLFLIFLLPAFLFAQQPKMYIKLFGGVQDHYYIVKSDPKIEDHLFGWHAGFGVRVSQKKIFGEIDFEWVRNSATVFVDTAIVGPSNQFEFKFNSFQIPVVVGFIPVKKPAFKWYVYTGPVNRFNSKGKISHEGETIEFKPKDVDLRAYNLDWRIGTQFDLYGFNFDFKYNVGVTNSSIDGFRTNSHMFMFSIGLVL